MRMFRFIWKHSLWLKNFSCFELKCYFLINHLYKLNETSLKYSVEHYDLLEFLIFLFERFWILSSNFGPTVPIGSWSGDNHIGKVMMRHCLTKSSMLYPNLRRKSHRDFGNIGAIRSRSNVYGWSKF